MIELGCIVVFKEEFVKCNVKVIVLSVDLIEDYMKWFSDIEEMQNVKMNFFIIVDFDKKVVVVYDMIYLEVDQKFIVCLVFVIDFNKKICLMLIYLLLIGWNFYEILCVIDFL